MQSKRETGPQPRDSNVDAHRDDGKRFVVHADEKLTAFLEPEVAIAAIIDVRHGTGARVGDYKETPRLIFHCGPCAFGAGLKSIWPSSRTV
jgi:hypothetical protein